MIKCDGSHVEVAGKGFDVLAELCSLNETIAKAMPKEIRSYIALFLKFAIDRAVGDEEEISDISTETDLNGNSQLYEALKKAFEDE